MAIFRSKRNQASYLEGQVLIAMPNMPDPKMEQSVLFLCAHSEKGAMALCLNKLVSNITFFDLLRQLRIRPGTRSSGVPIQFGGPVETGRGFVLHSPDYSSPSTTVKVGNTVGLTASVDVLKAIAEGRGPKQAMVALGYAGWGAGQLENEIQRNGWLTCPADEYLLFGNNLAYKWEHAMRKLGVNPAQLSRDAGRA